MMAKQMIYTSCRRGRGSTGSGFQVYSYTDGISKETRDRLVKLGSYSLGSTGFKTISDDYSDYPVAYRFCPVGECKSIIRSSYLGLDWSRTRVGSNYLSHSIVFNESDESVESYPVLYIDSESFEKTPRPEFALDEEPGALEEIEPKETDLTFKEVCDFITCRKDGINVVKTTISRLSRGESMFISDTPENLKMWIAACTMILPPVVAWNIPFTTYDQNGWESQFQSISGGPSIICVWSSGDDHSFKTSPLESDCEFDRDYRGLFSDYLNKVFSNPMLRDEYVENVTNSVLNGVDTIDNAIVHYVVCTELKSDNPSKELYLRYRVSSCFTDG